MDVQYEAQGDLTFVEMLTKAYLQLVTIPNQPKTENMVILRAPICLALVDQDLSALFAVLLGLSTTFKQTPEDSLQATMEQNVMELSRYAYEVLLMVVASTIVGRLKDDPDLYAAVAASDDPDEDFELVSKIVKENGELRQAADTFAWGKIILESMYGELKLQEELTENKPLNTNSNGANGANKGGPIM
jgi:hypothetical protein